MPNTMTRFQPETSLTRLPDMIDQLFRESFVVPTPFERFFNGGRSVNLLETENEYIVQLLIPGVDIEKLQIQVVGQQLTFKAVRTIPMVEHATYVYHGLFDEELSEVFTLPAEVDGEKAVAKYVNGLLTITLPKTEYAKPKTVKITTTI